MTRSSSQAIVRDVRRYNDYEYTALDEALLATINRYGTSSGVPKTVHNLSKFLECFLQVSGQLMSLSDSPSQFRAKCELFIGALNSERFFLLAQPVRYRYTVLFIQLMSKGQIKTISHIPPIQCASNKTTGDIEILRLRAEALQLHEEKKWLWRNWPSINLVGTETWFPLYPVYRRVGRAFTGRLYRVADEYYVGRRSCNIPCFSELCHFIGDYPGQITEQDFRDSSFVSDFLTRFHTAFMTGRCNRANINSRVRIWCNNFMLFMEDHVLASGLMAPPYGGVPKPSRTRMLREKKIQLRAASKEDETFEPARLITKIPLNVSNCEAMEILHNRLKRDLDIAVTWATAEAADMWERYNRRCALEKAGTPSKVGRTGVATGQRWRIDRANPLYMANAAATLASFGGHLTQRDATLQIILPGPMQTCAHELALPTSTSLVPHMTLLVAEHPDITPSFLEGLELYDEHGRLTGMVEVMGSTRLIGFKRRKGPELAQKEITLTPTTKEIVRQVIALTAGARAYLKAHNNDDWRYLFLMTGRAFGVPRRITEIAHLLSYKPRRNAFAKSLQRRVNLSHGEVMAYARRFSLRAVRAQAAVLVYLQTNSVVNMSNALGHKEFTPELLYRYLPEPLVAFHRDRDIRIFQQAIIVQAMSGSEYLLDATDFKSMNEVTQFLTNQVHMLIPKRALDWQTEESNTHRTEPDCRVCISVELNGMAVLVALSMAVASAIKAISGQARYWNVFACRLIGYIEENRTRKPELAQCLDTARRLAQPSLFEAHIYA